MPGPVPMQGTLALPPGPLYGYIAASHSVASGTSGGTATAGAWTTRIINTLDADSTGLCTLAANVLTIPPGGYRLWSCVPFLGTNNSKSRIFNTTAGVVLINGSSCYSLSTTLTGVTASNCIGRFTTPTAIGIRLDYWATVGASVFNLGVNTSTGSNEVYAQLTLWKEF